MLDWVIRFRYKTAEIHFLGISCSIFSLFTFHLENSTLSAHVKPSLENDSSNLLISIGVVINITVHVLNKIQFYKISVLCLYTCFFFVCVHESPPSSEKFLGYIFSVKMIIIQYGSYIQ